MMRWMRCRFGLVPATMLAVAILGCSDQPTRLPTYPVHGRITVAGKSAVGVQVYLRRADGQSVAEMPMNPHAITGDDGRFAMSTYTDDDGAPEGEYVAILHWPTPVRESTQDRLRGLFDKNKIAVIVKPASENVIPTIPLPSIDGEGKPIDVRPSVALIGN